MPVEDFLVLPGLFSSSSSSRRKREKTRGKRENPFRMKKRLPNLSSAVTLSLLSYLAQSPTGRCQSGRMSTPGKCVYRKPVPRVRIPPCPPLIFRRNIFVMSILRFLFVGHGEKMGKIYRKHIDKYFTIRYTPETNCTPDPNNVVRGASREKSRTFTLPKMGRGQTMVDTQ